MERTVFALSSVRVTRHGRSRTKDRTGLSKGLAEKNAERAFRYGLKHGETKGRLFKYVTSLYFKNRTANNIRVFHGKVYIFSNDVLITVLNLPGNLVGLADKLEKRKEDENGDEE